MMLIACKCGKKYPTCWARSGPDNRSAYFYKCRACGLKTPERKTIEAARAAWNEIVKEDAGEARQQDAAR